MKRSSIFAIVTLLAFTLGGCFPKSKDRLEASCELDATKFAATHDKDTSGLGQMTDIANMTELCMRTHGYRVVNDFCPPTHRINVQKTPIALREFFYDEQKEDPLCYERVSNSWYK